MSFEEIKKLVNLFLMLFDFRYMEIVSLRQWKIESNIIQVLFMQHGDKFPIKMGDVIDSPISC